MDQPTNAPLDDLWEAKALAALERAVVGENGIPDSRRALAVQVVIALMKAGLPIADLRADAFEGRAGAAIAVVPGPRRGLQVLWRQHPHLDAQSPGEPWRTQQTAMHTAVRTILEAQGYLLREDQPPSEAPVVIALSR